jgi:SpoVK/Ycf46/Vps4 family AAA+-type ATPase
LRTGARVLGAWGFAAKGVRPGLTALFFGPSGTGKTMAAGIVAAELGLDLFRIDLAATVSKYIGETEKNLDRVFGAALSSNAMLFFDEADALFGKRSEVRDAHDRYANIEVSYLLQKMDSYSGGVILATNLRRHIDDAFARRLTFSISFPFPEAESRRRLWHGVWPAQTPLAPDIDLDELADAVRLSGGNIVNVAAAAAFLAASADEPVGRPHLVRAIRTEFLKMGVAAPDLTPAGTAGVGA